MKIITKNKQKEIDEMFIKKLRFVAREAVRTHGHFNSVKEYEDILNKEMDRAEQVFYADDVI